MDMDMDMVMQWNPKVLIYCKLYRRSYGAAVLRAFFWGCSEREDSRGEGSECLFAVWILPVLVHTDRPTDDPTRGRRAYYVHGRRSAAAAN